MEYIDRYDRDGIDNHDMSRIQRRFANKPFWNTFTPSRDMIHKYGRGNRSTRWAMFEKKNGNKTYSPRYSTSTRRLLLFRIEATSKRMKVPKLRIRLKTLTA